MRIELAISSVANLAFLSTATSTPNIFEGPQTNWIAVAWLPFETTGNPVDGDSRKRAEPILRWKYSVRCPDESEHERPVSKPNAEVYEDDFLYDLRADPWKQTTLISAPNFRDIVTAMRKRLIARMTSIGEN